MNPDALNQLLGQMANDLGAAVNGALVVLGDRLGISIALADIGPATSQELAEGAQVAGKLTLRQWPPRLHINDGSGKLCFLQPRLAKEELFPC